MKTTFCLFLISGSFCTVLAQNTAVVSQQSSASGTEHEVFIVQQGSGHMSVVRQSNRGIDNRAVIHQSGTGNVATINQRNGLVDSLTQSGQSVYVTQSGAGETVIDQTDGHSTIRIHQSRPAAPLPTDAQKKGQPDEKRPR